MKHTHTNKSKKEDSVQAGSAKNSKASGNGLEQGMEQSGVVRMDDSGYQPFQDNSGLQKDLMDSKELERANRFGKVNERESIIRKTKDGPLQKTPIKPKTSEAKQPLKDSELPVFLKKELDMLYVGKILKELKDNSMQYSEREEILEEYKRLTMYTIRQLEGGGQVRKLDADQKAEVIREVNRVFAAKFEKAGPFKEFTQRLVKYRMEDLRREVKENQWKIHLRFLGEMLRLNPKNKDLLEKIRLKKLPGDLRILIWRQALLNPKIEEEYSALLRRDRILTVSQFEMNILKEVTAFAYKYTSQELFDTAMLNAMKVILSYVEKKTDIIISDYHYLLAIPLLVAFSEERWMLSQPTELIGFFFSVLDIVKFLDPAGGLSRGGLRTAVTDDSKEFVRVGEMLDLLERYDPTLREHIQKFMAEESNRKSFTILYRKFVQSLGFNYINVDSCLFLWDQIFLKVKPLPDEMSQAFVALLLAAKEELMLSSKFSEFAEMVYLKGKAVSIDAYISKYIQVSAGATFYEERYNYEEIPVEAY